MSESQPAACTCSSTELTLLVKGGGRGGHGVEGGVESVQPSSRSGSAGTLGSNSHGNA